MTRLLLAATLACLVLAGCSGATPPPATPTAVPDAAGAVPRDRAVVGAYTLHLDPATGDVALDSVRLNAAYGDNYWVNATGFLDGAPCHDCLEATGVHFDPDGNAVVTVRARHPFQPGNIALPPTAANRLDLHVFDAQLMLAANRDSSAFGFTGDTATLPAGVLIDPAGYSGLMASVISTIDPGLGESAYPYMIIGEDRTAGNYASTNPNGFADLLAPTGHNVFPMGADIETELTLAVGPGDSPLDVLLLFSASYGASVSNKSERLMPRYPLPEFNAKAPWRVAVDIPSATNTLEAGVTTSSAAVEVRVWDWQAGAAIDPTLADLGAVRSSSTPSTVELIVPGVLDTPLDLGAAVSGTGPLDNPLVYQGLILNAAAALEGSYVGAVRVLDDRAPGLNSGGQTDGLSSIDGTSVDPVILTEFVTYQTFIVDVGGAADALLSIAITPGTRQIIAQGSGEAITFTAEGTYSSAPILRDITTSVTWVSSTLDVATFAANVLTGIGMGTTQVTATLDTITSPATVVIVKPLEFANTATAIPLAMKADPVSGRVYVVYQSPASIRVFDDAANFITTFTILPSTSLCRAPGIDPNGTGRLFLHETSGVPGAPINVYTFGGSPMGSFMTVVQGFGPMGTQFDQSGTLWSNLYTPSGVVRINSTTGAQIGSIINLPNNSFPQGIDSFGTLLAIATPGGRTTGQAAVVVDTVSNTVVASSGTVMPPVFVQQNDPIAFDRDGYIHTEYGGQSSPTLTQPWVQAYEYLPSSETLSLLYSYQPSNPNVWAGRGMCISRPNNVVTIGRGFGGPGGLTWLD